MELKASGHPKPPSPQARVKGKKLLTSGEDFSLKPGHAHGTI